MVRRQAPDSRLAQTGAALFVLTLLGCSSPQPQQTQPEPAQAVATPEPAAQPAPMTFVGRWIGVGEQDPPGARATTWDVVAEIQTTDPGMCGTIEYPSLGCGGVWICEPDFDGQVLRAREQLRATTSCVDGGIMEMRLTPEGGLQWRHEAQGIRAWAILTRPR